MLINSFIKEWMVLISTSLNSIRPNNSSAARFVYVIHKTEFALFSPIKSSIIFSILVVLPLPAGALIKKQLGQTFIFVAIVSPFLYSQVTYQSVIRLK